MFPTMKDSHKTIVFTLLVLFLAVAFSYIPGIIGFVYMMTPALAVLIMMLIVTRDGYTRAGWRRLGLHKLGMKGWGFALLVPILPLAAGFGLVWITGLSSLVIGSDFEGYSWGIFPLLMVILYVKTVLMESMGEELGWRGYLLPLMLGCMSKRKAMLLNGLIHGVWHFPIILNTTTYHDGENLWLLLPLTLASTIFLAPVIGELRLRTGSVWTASMLHTTHNLFVLIFTAITIQHAEAATYIAGDMSLTIILFYMWLTWAAWRKKRGTSKGLSADVTRC